jgi:3-oxoacyl-[acyl-carrier protein] reductase
MTMLEHRVVLITGASRGIGAATARLLAKHGAASTERVVRDITSEGGNRCAGL